MKLQTKLLGSLLGGVILVGVSSQWLQYRQNLGLLNREAERSLAQEEGVQWTWRGSRPWTGR